MDRTHIIIIVVIFALVPLCCSRPPPVVRPIVGNNPITVVPPTPTSLPDEPPLPDVQHAEQLRAILNETDLPIRIRIFAHPLEDETSQELVRVTRDILSLAPGRTRFDLTDPLQSDVTNREARILGVEPLGTIPQRRIRRDPLPQDASYRALVIAIGNEHLTVPQVTADRGDLDFQVAEALSRLMHGPRLVGLVSSEERLDKLVKLKRVLDRLDVRSLSLDTPIPDEYSAVLVVGPGEKLTSNHVNELRRFLDKGRSIALLVDGMEVEPAHKRYTVKNARTGLDDFLQEYGVKVAKGFVFDNYCGRVSVPAKVGRMLVPYPPIPTIRVAPQESTPDARTLRLPFPSALLLQPRNDVETTLLLQSTEESWAVKGSYNLSPFQEWAPTKSTGPFVLGALLVKRDKGSQRLAVIANSRFVNDNYLSVADNAVFVRQLVEWLGGHKALTRLIHSRRTSAERAKRASN